MRATGEAEATCATLNLANVDIFEAISIVFLNRILFFFSWLTGASLKIVTRFSMEHP